MIIFKQNIDLSRLRTAYNNDILNFYSSLPSQPDYCDITFNDTPIRLYPAPDGTFFLNLKPYVTSFINTRNFEDTLQPAISGFNPVNYVYDFKDGSYLNTNLYMTIRMKDGSHDDNGYNLGFIAAVQQLNDQHRRTTDEYFLLSPLQENSTQHYFIKYWQGYPFDISLYTPPGKYFYLQNTTTLLQQQLPTKARVARLVFSDGRTDETLENLLPLVEGINEVRYMSSSTEKTTDKFITLQKVPYQKGVYLKWLNPQGGYSYWLFEDIHTINRSTKYTGEIDRDYHNLSDSFGRSIAIGKESRDTMRILAEMLNPNESRIVETLLDSPKIYLFTGKPFAQNGKNNWMEVTLKTTNSRIKNAKQPIMSFTFDIELPERYTLSL